MTDEKILKRLANERRLECRDTARFILSQDPVFLDTETTGFGTDDQIITISAINSDTDILFNIKVRPEGIKEIPAAATAVHGFTYEMLKDCVTIDNWADVINRNLQGKWIVAYNATFDIRMLYQSLARYPDPKIKFGAAYAGIFDAMQLYSKFRGEPGQYGSFKWYKLGDAARDLSLEFDASSLHGSLADTHVLLMLFRAIADWIPEND